MIIFQKLFDSILIGLSRFNQNDERLNRLFSFGIVVLNFNVELIHPLISETENFVLNILSKNIYYKTYKAYPWICPIMLHKNDNRKTVKRWEGLYQCIFVIAVSVKIVSSKRMPLQILHYVFLTVKKYIS